MLPELLLAERQTSLATPGPSLLVRIGRYVHPHRTVRASVSDVTCFRIGRYASATVISALLNGVSVRLFGVPLSVGDIAVCVVSAAEGVDGYENCRGDSDVGRHGRAKGDRGIGNGFVLAYGHIKHVKTDSANLFLLQEVFFLLREFECGLPVIDGIGLLVQPCSRGGMSAPLRLVQPMVFSAAATARNIESKGVSLLLLPL